MSLASGSTSNSVGMESMKDSFGPVSKLSKNIVPPHRINSLSTIVTQGGPPGGCSEATNNLDINLRIVASRYVGVSLRRLMRRALLGFSLTLMLVTLMAIASTATAVAAPVWRIDSVTNTTALPGSTFTYHVDFVNVGTSTANGTTTMTVTLPAGLTGTSGFGFNPNVGFASCTAAASGFQCDTGGPVPTGSAWTFALDVAVDPSVPTPTTLTSSVVVTGDGVSATTVDPTRIDDPPGFGLDAFDGQVAADASGTPSTQAGGHPYSATVSFDVNTVTNPLLLLGDVWPVEAIKDTIVDLPPGFVGSTTGVDECTAAQLANTAFQDAEPLCSATSQVGTVLLHLNGLNLPARTFASNALGPFPVFNMAPPPGAPAAFGFNAFGNVVILTARLRSNGDYGLSVDGNDLPEGLSIAGTTFTFWGVPSDASHDSERACPGRSAPYTGDRTCPSGAPPRAFLRNPTSCTAPAGSPVQDGLATSLAIDSWVNPGARDANGDPAAGDPRWQTGTWVTHAAPGYPYPPSAFGGHLLPTGCDKVPFSPSFDFRPAVPSVRANSPTPFQVDLSLPQSDDPTSIGESDLKKVVVTLPEGVRVSPSSADGLGACSPDRIGLHSTADPSCPDSSKIGTLTIKTPLIDEELTGSVYLATPHDNPFHSLIAIYLVAKGAGSIVKLASEVDTDPVTGQLTATVDNNPQLPFSSFHLEFKGGSRAALLTPPQCGTYTTHAVLTPWARPDSPVSSDSSFTVDTNSDGSPCAPAGFSPGLAAGTTRPIASKFSPFVLRLQRTDDEEELKALQSLSLPPGILADVGSVPVRCTEAQARAAACPAASHIGTVLTGAGAGPDPFYVPGDVYLMGGFGSGPFKGDPFGLAVVVHAQAGPFDLGYVVVEAGIQVHDDGSISSQTEPFPSILDGIPLDLKDIRLSVDRPDFILNPTNCSQMTVAGSVVSTEGVTAPVSSRFQVGECAALDFKPSFTVSTAGKTSKANGASLHVHLGTHEGPGSTGATRESNIAKVDVQLPVSLPARLTTLQKACTAAQFASNPAGCPEASFVGSAIAHTPILASPLSGPAILVSHGGQAFPDLVLVLQGEGVRLNITGHTQIRKGITFSHFETVPDAPVASFDLTLPQGPHSALTTDIPGHNLCTTTKTVTVTKRITRRVHGHNRKVKVKAKKAIAASLLMPTTITAQNGAVIHQNTRIAVTGCAAVKSKAKKKKAKGHKH
jgi:hypothetical protein